MFHPPAQGCEEPATLGSRFKRNPTLKGLQQRDRARSRLQPLQGLGLVFLAVPQGSARRANIGWMTERRWRFPLPMNLLDFQRLSESRDVQGAATFLSPSKARAQRPIFSACARRHLPGAAGWLMEAACFRRRAFDLLRTTVLSRSNPPKIPPFHPAAAPSGSSQSAQ